MATDLEKVKTFLEHQSDDTLEAINKILKTIGRTAFEHRLNKTRFTKKQLMKLIIDIANLVQDEQQKRSFICLKKINHN